jgi:hypothetical protein
MALDVRFLKQHELIVVSASGAMYLDDVIETISRFARDPDFVWNHDRIVILKNDVEFSELNAERLTDIMTAMKQSYLEGKELDPSGQPAYRYAVVVGSTINKVMMGLFGAVLESDKVSRVALQKFDSVSDALAWLGRENIPESEFEEEMQDI